MVTHARALAIQPNLHGSAAAMLAPRAAIMRTANGCAQWPAHRPGATAAGCVFHLLRAPTHRAFFVLCARRPGVPLRRDYDKTGQGPPRPPIRRDDTNEGERERRPCATPPLPLLLLAVSVAARRAALLAARPKKSGGDHTPSRAAAALSRLFWLRLLWLPAAAAALAWLLWHHHLHLHSHSHVCLLPLPLPPLSLSSRNRSRTHLATFPKLIGTERQHNTVETAEVRYVYQPIESLILVLMTSSCRISSRTSETLRLFSKLIPEYCPGEVDETSVCKHAFELLFAFDELIACGVGHRENLTLQQVQANLEMESHEEKLAIMIRQSKEREAQQEAERRRKQIARDNRSKGIGGGGFAGGVSSMRDFADDLRSGAASAAATIEAQTGASFDPSYSRPTSAPPPKAGTGMKLGKKGGGAAPMGSSLLQGLEAEADAAVAATPPRSGGGAAAGGGGGGGGGVAAGLTLSAEEKLSVTMSRDGGLQSLEVNGILQLLNSDADAGKAIVPLQMGPNPGFQFKTHPNIDKQLYASDQCLGLRDPTRPFPVGSAVGVLKWRLASTDESLVPLVINCWPTQVGYSPLTSTHHPPHPPPLHSPPSSPPLTFPLHHRRAARRGRCRSSTSSPPPTRSSRSTTSP